ncbi:hypothetical protein BLOT_014700 [Blomia tropicalis]|nr:hypothetical protein BLOT_014700 [Blomia tropicalis]
MSTIKISVDSWYRFDIMIKTEEEEEGPPPSFPMAKTGNLDVTLFNSDTLSTACDAHIQTHQI